MDPAARFVTLINAPAQSAHLDVLCGLIGEAFDRRATVAATCAELDLLVDGVTPTFEGLMAALFGSGLFAGDVEQYHAVDNSLLHRVLERRRGMPITLSVVALEVGRRLGVPLYGIGLPGHFVVRDATRELYADPFGGGVLMERSELQAMWQRRTGGTSLDAIALVPVTTRALVLRILNNLRASLGADPDPYQAAALARLRGAFDELDAEEAERRRLLRHWN
jgi:regulator of sirC expression with transglutaminase-like and TPR domain